jgi:hypothetical protein
MLIVFYGKVFVNIEILHGILKLDLGGSFITFQKSWIDQLINFFIERYGEFIRSNIYPSLSVEEKKI